MQRVPYEGVSRMQTSLRRYVPPDSCMLLRKPCVLVPTLPLLLAGSTATASCAGARLPLEPCHASICNHHVLIVSLCLIRRGLALIIESDFYATDAGRAHFADQLTSIR